MAQSYATGPSSSSPIRGCARPPAPFLNNAIVPTALERTGNFTLSNTKPTDPATGTTFVCNGVTGVICANRLDPVAMQIINKYIPLSNVPGNIWQGNVPSPFNTDEVMLKIDHQINAAHRLTGSYFETAGTNTVRAGSGNLPWASQQFNWRQHNLNLSDVWVIDSSKVNQAWVSYTRNFGGRLNLPQTSLGDLGSTFTTQGHAFAAHRSPSADSSPWVMPSAGRPQAAISIRSATVSVGPRANTPSSSAARSRSTKTSSKRCSTTTACSPSTTA